MTTDVTAPRRLPGRDRHAVWHAPPAPTNATTGATRDLEHVVVVGGGIAGLCAAVVLAERGVAVTVIEAQDTLGGRVRSWPIELPAADTGAGQRPATMSRGFHAFFRQYYNLRSILRRTDPHLHRLRPLADYPLLHADGLRDSFAGIPTTPPWSIAAFAARSPSFPLAELVRVDLRRALDLLLVRYPASFSAYDGRSAAQVLDDLRFPRAARHLALEVFARSFFADPRDFSGAELVAMFHTYFLGSAEGLLFDVPTGDYDRVLWAPLADYLRDRGVTIHTGARVTQIRDAAPNEPGLSPGGDQRADSERAKRVSVLCRSTVTEVTASVDGEGGAGRLPEDALGRQSLSQRSTITELTLSSEGRYTGQEDGACEELVADAVVLAADLGGTQRLLAQNPQLGAVGGAGGFGGADGRAWRESIARLRHSPRFAVWRLWLDTPERPGAAPFAGTAGYAELDNVSFVHLFEEEAAQWVQAHGGSVVELHAYALREDDERPLDEEALRRSLREQLIRIHPELRDAATIHEEWLIEGDCPLVTPEPWERRPGVATPDPRVVLAGDWVRCDLPVALMERAATTGIMAADLLLSRAGRTGEGVWSPPLEGVLRRARTALTPVARRVAGVLGRPHPGRASGRDQTPSARNRSPRSRTGSEPVRC